MRVGILLTCGKDLHDHIITESDRSSICVLGCRFCLFLQFFYLILKLVRLSIFCFLFYCKSISVTGQFQSSAVINALRDLLRNKSSNVRAVAAVSLVKSGDKDPSTVDNLMKCLNDKDRLVREAGCLALGQLQSKKAVPKLLHLWYVLYKMSLIC